MSWLEELRRLRSPAELGSSARRRGAGVVLLDLSEAGAAGLAELDQARRLAPDLARVALVGDDLALARAALARGAHDALRSDELDPATAARSFRHAVTRAGLERCVAERSRELGSARDRLTQRARDEVTPRLRASTQQDRIESLGRMAAHIGHELNNPLGFVDANLRFVEESLAELETGLAQLAPGTDPPRREGVEQLLRETREMRAATRESIEGTERLASIVADIKIFTHAREQELAPVSPRRALLAALRMASGKLSEHARLRTRLAPLPRVNGDETRLIQVFLNLLVNAADACRDAPDREHEIRVETYTAESGQAVVEIRDTGSGIPETLRDRIFDPFFTTKPRGEGSGFGLAICVAIVTRLGGELELSPAGDAGTVARLRLPALAGEPDPRPARAGTPGVAPGDRPRVLIVDRERARRTRLMRALTEFEVEATASLSDALGQLATEPADLVLCDVAIQGAAGARLYQELWERAPELADRVLFLGVGEPTESFVQEVRDILSRRSGV